MINIVIAGGGTLGRHIANILAREQHNVIVLDTDMNALNELQTLGDITTQKGSATDWVLLKNLLEFSPDIFIALTGCDETNLVACSIAKQLLYPKTIARIHQTQFLNRTRLDFAQMFDVDHFICPESTTAYDILKYIISPGSLALENFAHGILQLRTLLIPEEWQTNHLPLNQFNLPQDVIVGLIRRSVRDEETLEMKAIIIFPHGEDTILPGDEVTFIGATDQIASLDKFFDIAQKEIRSVVILGGSATGIQLGQLLSERKMHPKIIEKNYQICLQLAESLPHCTIVHHDPTDVEFLRAEKVESSDLLVACTNMDEVNIVSAMLGKEIGCPNVTVVLNNLGYASILEKLNIKHVNSPRISATNQILAQLFSGRVNSLVSLYENQAEVLEINVSMNSKIAGIPISDIGPFLPRDCLIVMIQNRGRITIAHGNSIISPGDTVIVVTNPKHIKEIQNIF